MVVAFDPSKEIRYICKSDRKLKPEKRTIFLLKFLTASEAARMEDGVASITTDQESDEKNEMKIKSGSQTLKTLQEGLKGWKNLLGADGKPVEFRENNGVPRPEMFDLIPPKERRELANVIAEGKDISEEDSKN